MEFKLTGRTQWYEWAPLLCTLALTNFSAKIHLFSDIFVFVGRHLFSPGIFLLQIQGRTPGGQEALRQEASSLGIQNSRRPGIQEVWGPGGQKSRRPGKQQIFRKTKSEVYEARRQESRSQEAKISVQGQESSRWDWEDLIFCLFYTVHKVWLYL